MRSSPGVQHQLAALGAVELGAGDLNEVLRAIAELVTNQFGAMGAGLVLADEADGSMVIAASTIVDSSGREVEGPVTDDNGLNQWIVETGRTVVASSPADMPLGTSRVAVRWGVRAFMAVPITLREKPMGVLHVFHEDQHDWQSDDLLFLETVARRAAVAIDNARLLQETRRARDRAEMLSRMGRALINATSYAELLETAGDVIIETLPAERVHIITIDQIVPRVLDHHIGGAGDDTVTRDNYEELMTGFTGWVLREGRSLLSPKGVPDDRESPLLQERRLENDGGSILVVPLRYRSQLLGTLTATRNTSQPDFEPADVELVESMANLVAVEVVKSRLHESNEAAANEVMALYQVAQALNREGGIEELMQGLSEAVVSALGADRVSLYVTDVEKQRVLYTAQAGTGELPNEDEMDFEQFSGSMCGWVLRNRRSALVPHGAHDARETDAAFDRRSRAGEASMVVVPLFHSGRPLGALCAYSADENHQFAQRDVTLAFAMGSQMSIALANALLFEETQRLAITDELTGIHNRRQLFTLGERELRAARRYGRPLAGIMFDLDYFKIINDTHGHAVGDEVLQEVVKRARKEVREVDVFGRYGGEEFGMVLPEAGLSKAIEIGERLRIVVAEEPIMTSAGPLNVTISVGVAAISSDMQNIQALLDRADAAMFAAKHKGRNIVQSG